MNKFLATFILIIYSFAIFPVSLFAKEITYPDGEVVTYSYDDAGQVNAITGANTLGDVFEYVKKIGYDEYSQRTLIEYGSGVVTEYFYDPERRWLKTMKSVNSKGEILQNYIYSFDTAGNVTSYINDCLGSSYQTTEQKYTYDALYQLIKAEGIVSYQETSRDYKNFKSNYTQTFEYDSIGNLVKKTSKGTDLDIKFNQDPLNYTQDYIYDSDYAHRLKSINNQTFFLYDKNGNIIEMSDESYEPKYDPQFRTFLNSQGATIYRFLIKSDILSQFSRKNHIILWGCNGGAS